LRGLHVATELFTNLCCSLMIKKYNKEPNRLKIEKKKQYK